MPTLTLPLSKLPKLTVTIRAPRGFHLRVWIGTRLARLAFSILGWRFAEERAGVARACDTMEGFAATVKRIEDRGAH